MPNAALPNEAAAEAAAVGDSVDPQWKPSATLTARGGDRQLQVASRQAQAQADILTRNMSSGAVAPGAGVFATAATTALSGATQVSQRGVLSVTEAAAAWTAPAQDTTPAWILQHHSNIGLDKVVPRLHRGGSGLNLLGDSSSSSASSSSLSSSPSSSLWSNGEDIDAVGNNTSSSNAGDGGDVTAAHASSVGTQTGHATMPAWINTNTNSDGDGDDSSFAI